MTTSSICLKKAHRPSVNIVGAGKVASTLAITWHQSKLINMQAVWNRSFSAAEYLKNHIPHIQVHKQLETLPPADIIVIGVSDQFIEEIGWKIHQIDWLKADTLILHFSGALNSNILIPKNHKKFLVGSLHPVFAFASIETAINTLPGHLCAIEGDAKALSLLHKLAQAANLTCFNIDSAQKKRYHAALSISANFLVTLNAFARNILISLSLPQELAETLVNQLMQQNLNQLQIMSPEEALTGPIKRGDSNTIARHWKALEQSEQTLYKVLAEQTLHLTTLSAEKQQQILQIINSQEN